jgi:hypothetical protein
MSAGRALAAEGRTAHADMADAAERPIDQHCLDYFAAHGAEHLTFDMRGAWRPKAGKRPLDGRVRPRAHASSLLAMGECTVTNPLILTTTVAQYFATNSAFDDLWRSSCCANSAPGQPQATLNQ